MSWHISPAPGNLSVRLQQPAIYFALAFIVAVVGFWPSFFSKLATTDAAHLIHGVSATLWMAIPILQAWLASRGRIAAHRRIGRVALLLVPILVLSALHMVQLMMVRYEQTHALRLLKFAFLDLTALALFVVFLGLALWSIHHRDVAAHKRYMACTALFALEPALERVFVFYVPGVSGFENALYLALISMEIILAVLLVFDWRRGRRISVAFAVTLAFFLAIHLLATPVATSSAFREFALRFVAARAESLSHL